METLETLPALIARQEEKVRMARESYQIAKVKYDVNKAKHILRVSSLKNLNQQQQTAKVIIFLEEDNLELIQLDNSLSKEEIEFNRLVNTFISVRKQTNYKIAEMDNLE